MILVSFAAVDLFIRRADLILGRKMQLGLICWWLNSIFRGWPIRVAVMASWGMGGGGFAELYSAFGGELIHSIPGI